MSFKKMPATQTQSAIRLVDFTHSIKEHKFCNEESHYLDGKTTQKIHVTFELLRHLPVNQTDKDIDILILPKLKSLEEVTPETIQQLLTHNSQQVRAIALFIQQLLPEDDEPPF